MAFALRHALNNNQQRVIVAVPFITITEQTADTYRQIFESTRAMTFLVVLEHHSGGKQISQADDDFGQYDVWRPLAAENWDASIIVTTTVQLFESLFSNMRSRSRKNHRLARSVIILDEAQALPIALLDPTSTHYANCVSTMARRWFCRRRLSLHSKLFQSYLRFRRRTSWRMQTSIMIGCGECVTIGASIHHWIGMKLPICCDRSRKPFPFSIRNVMPSPCLTHSMTPQRFICQRCSVVPTADE